MKITAKIIIALLAATPVAAQDAGHGEKIFKKCKACHTIGPKAKNRVGPVLTGVVGRPAGSYEGYKYGTGMKAAGAAGLIWTEDNLLAYLAGPKAFLRDYLSDPKAKAKMTFHLKKEQDRRDMVAYLATFSTAAADAPTTTATDATASTATTATTPAMDKSGQVCVLNSTKESHFFATEAGDGSRQTSELAPGAELCSVAVAGKTTGIVSVYDSVGAYEGCSRITDVGKTETLVKFVDFDRCFWGSNL